MTTWPWMLLLVAMCLTAGMFLVGCVYIVVIGVAAWLHRDGGWS